MATTLFTTSLQTQPAGEDSQTLSPRTVSVTMEVSSSIEQRIKVPEGCFLMLVISRGFPSSSHRASFVDGSTMELTPSQGAVWLLPPESLLTLVESEIESAIQYLIPGSSIAAFARHSGITGQVTLAAPQVLNDTFLQLLSKLVVPLLSAGKRQLRGASVVRYFLSSMFSHLVSSYGTSEVASERAFHGGLAPRHKNLIQSLLSSPENMLLSGDDLAARCGLSVTHFGRAFRQSFGTTVHKHLISLRLEHAKLLLAEGHLALEQVAQRAGYADQATFTESFKRFAGTSPGRFRRRCFQESTPVGTAARSLALASGTAPF